MEAKLQSELEQQQIEENEVKRRIHLVIFRHDQKAKNIPEGHDALVPLTPGGVAHAYESASELGIQNPAKIISSTRKRVMQTALLKWANVAKIPKADVIEQTVEELADLVTQSLKDRKGANRKIMTTDDRLNFDYESNLSFGNSFYKEYEQLKQNRTLDWQIEHSDQIVLDLAQKEPDEGLMKVSSYTRFAGDMAQMINRYVRAFGKLKILKKKENFDFDILMGTHSQNLECFLMRLIEIKEGKPALQSFLSKLNNRKGFVDFSEGLKVNIVEDKKDTQQVKKIEISFRDKKWDVTMQDLEIMIRDRDQFNEKVRHILDDNSKKEQ